MARTKSKAAEKRTAGHVNLPMSKKTKEGFRRLKDAMNVGGQADVFEKMVEICVAIMDASTPRK